MYDSARPTGLGDDWRNSDDIPSYQLEAWPLGDCPPLRDLHLALRTCSLTQGFPFTHSQPQKHVKQFINKRSIGNVASGALCVLRAELSALQTPRPCQGVESAAVSQSSKVPPLPALAKEVGTDESRAVGQAPPQVTKWEVAHPRDRHPGHLQQPSRERGTHQNHDRQKTLPGCQL